MLAPYNEIKKPTKREAFAWLRENGYDLVRKMWMRDTSCAKVQPLPSGKFLIQEFMWAG